MRNTQKVREKDSRTGRVEVTTMTTTTTTAKKTMLVTVTTATAAAAAAARVMKLHISHVAM